MHLALAGVQVAPALVQRAPLGAQLRLALLRIGLPARRRRRLRLRCSLRATSV
jgi:hypothetical protein